jgi:hypothetical protein
MKRDLGTRRFRPARHENVRSYHSRLPGPRSSSTTRCPAGPPATPTTLRSAVLADFHERRLMKPTSPEARRRPLVLVRLKRG